MAGSRTQSNDAADNTPAVRDARTVDVLDSEVFQRFLAAADGESTEVDADQVTIDIIGRILHADTVDDVLGGSQVTHARDYLDRPFALTGVRFNRSDFEGNGPAFYALLEGADADGVPVTITCGARNVLAQAWKLRDMNALPVRVTLQQSKRPTANGNYVMWLEKAAAPF